MRLRVVSDLHIDLFDDHGHNRINKICHESHTIDVLVIAGDLCEIDKAWEGVPGKWGLYGDTISKLAEHFPHVVAVLGNHEFYNNSFTGVGKYIPELMRSVSNYYCLDFLGYKRLYGKDFVGGTLWFPEQEDPLRYWEGMNDFHCIDDFRKYVHVMGDGTKRKIQLVADRDAIVVTHHAPSMRSVHERLINDPLTRLYYVHDCTEIICRQNPAMWIHGHLHNPVDYIHPASTTRVVSNPLGYPRQTGGKPNLIVTL